VARTTFWKEIPVSPEVYQAFERLIREMGLSRSVLEVGAVPGPDNLLAMESLQKVSERIGLNLEKASSGEGWQILQGDAHHMPQFVDHRFEAVLCNSTLEHDPFFWKTISEMFRVTAPGGWMVIGVPGFYGMGLSSFLPEHSFIKRAFRLLIRVAGAGFLNDGTLTLGEHRFPGDYYRFTEQAMREVLLAGLEDIRIFKVMSPPRIIGAGRKP
jgi:SAM-dependent methyltransferase